MTRAASLLSELRATLRQLESALVCFSGGIDSTLVLAVAVEQLGDRAAALTAVSPSLPARERRAAQELAKALGARHYLVESQELARPGYRANGSDRCFHCKSELYDLAQATAAAHGFAHVLNGTNLDDLGDYRPGLRAAENAAITSPLVALQVTKADVRDLAQLLGLPTWDKPALACLASRIPYGTSVTPERLAQIEQLESALYDLGFSQLRVRYHDAIARIELSLDELPRAFTEPTRSRILSAGKAAGFVYVAVDLAGYRMGSSNELLQGRSLRVTQ